MEKLSEPATYAVILPNSPAKGLPQSINPGTILAPAVPANTAV